MKFLIKLLLLCQPCFADNMEAGLKKVAEAIVIQYHIDTNIEQFIEKKVPREYVVFVQKYGVWTKFIVEQRLEYEWKF